jgi:signal transduction histidine kinase
MPSRRIFRDAILPAVIAALGALELVSMQPHGWQIGIAGETVACLALVWRRSHAMVACLVAICAVVAMYVLGPALNEPSLPIVILSLITFSLARYISGLQGTAGLALLGVGVTILYLTIDRRVHSWSDIVYVAALLLPPYVLGRITRRLWAQGRQLEAQQELIKDQAERDERDRIARDLHDVIAHSISAMVVQASAAQDLIRRDPERAEAAIAAVTATGREALAETSQLLHTVRGQADDSIEPAPGLRDLDRLIEGFRGSGLQVELHTEGPLTPLPASVDLSAYRIVQEVLTNALRYARDRRAALRLTSTPSALTIETENVAAAGTTGKSGFGLIGMAERISLLDGRLQHQLEGDGRFRLRAVLPLPGSDRL